MEVKIRFDKSVQENAEEYFSKSKKARQKLFGLEKAMPLLEKKLSEIEFKKSRKNEVKVKRQRKWFEKFHWTFTSNHFLVIAGKDAKSNELVVKKHMDKDDLYFHSEIHGAAHTVLKAEGKKPNLQDLLDAAVFAAVHSKAWGERLSSLDVYSVSPEQVSKKAQSGEALGTGAFMVYGKRNWFKKTPLDFALGVTEEKELLAGSVNAVKSNCVFFVKLIQGKNKKGDTAKKLRFVLKKKSGTEFDLDELNALLPSGGVELIE
ncbi:MAG: NFACT RNA binding domain-containing protein [Candidatus Diapherotrites archaeon]